MAPPPSLRAIDPQTEIGGPLHIQIFDDPPAQPSTVLTFRGYLSSPPKAVEFESVYTPRRGSLRHAAELNKRDEIVLLFGMPLALREPDTTPYSQQGWRGLDQDGTMMFVEVVQNLVRPLFKTNCQYFKEDITQGSLADWYSDFSLPRGAAFQEAFGKEAAYVPDDAGAEALLPWEVGTCPCALSSCKFDNFFGTECPKAASPKAESPAPTFKSWKSHWPGQWGDIREGHDGCVHLVKRLRGQWLLTLVSGQTGSKCTGSRTLKQKVTLLEPTDNPNVMMVGKDGAEGTMEIVRVTTRNAKGKVKRRTFYIKVNGQRVFVRKPVKK